MAFHSLRLALAFGKAPAHIQKTVVDEGHAGDVGLPHVLLHNPLVAVGIVAESQVRVAARRLSSA